MNMIQKKIIVMLFVLLSIFWYLVFSDEVNTRYTEFYFLTGWQYLDHMMINLTWGQTGNVTIYLGNKSDSTFNWKFSFVDSAIIAHGSTGVRVCMSENEKNIFGQYVNTDVDSFSIVSNGSGTRSLDLLFPAGYSGTYYGCIVYYPTLSESDSHLNTSARKAIFLDADIKSSASNYDIIARPLFRRANSNDGYSIDGVDFRLFAYQWWAWQHIYDSSLWSDPKININSDGIGSVNFVPPLDWSLYLVALKWSGTISVWYTGYWNNSITQFNFFSGIVADSLSDDYALKYYDNGFTGNYIRVWDILSNNSGNYDLIKDSDFALMTDNLTVSFTPSHFDWYDLDKNEKINALEQTMLLDSYNRVWFITQQSHLTLSYFATL